MKLYIQLNVGDRVVKETEGEYSVPNNDFESGALVAMRLLFREHAKNKDIDSVTAYVVRPMGSIADEPFFYAEMN